MTDIVDEIDRLYAEATTTASDIRHQTALIELQSYLLGHWSTLRDRLREAERKAKAFEAIERGFLSSGGLLDVMSRDGRIERSIRLPDEDDGPEAMEAFDLLTAIEAALTEETKT